MASAQLVQPAQSLQNAHAQLGLVLLQLVAKMQSDQLDGFRVFAHRLQGGQPQLQACVFFKLMGGGQNGNSNPSSN